MFFDCCFFVVFVIVVLLLSFWACTFIDLIRSCLVFVGVFIGLCLYLRVLFSVYALRMICFLESCSGTLCLVVFCAYVIFCVFSAYCSCICLVFSAFKSSSYTCGCLSYNETCVLKHGICMFAVLVYSVCVASVL